MPDDDTLEPLMPNVLPTDSLMHVIVILTRLETKLTAVREDQLADRSKMLNLETKVDHMDSRLTGLESKLTTTDNLANRAQTSRGVLYAGLSVLAGVVLGIVTLMIGHIH